MQEAVGFMKLLSEAKASIKEISPDDVIQKQRENEPFVFVDVRENEEWNDGHASGAVHVGRGYLELRVEGLVPDKDTELVLYCGGGTRSALAAHTLQKMGYSRVYSMAGGMRAWRERNLPEVREN